MTSGTVKGKKIWVFSVRFGACSDVTQGRTDPTLLDSDWNVCFHAHKIVHFVIP